MNTKIKNLEEKLPKKCCSYCKHLSLEGPNKDFTYNIKCIISDDIPLNADLCENFDPENTNFNTSDLDAIYIKFLESNLRVDYNSYLKSLHWQIFKEKALNHYNNQCSKCGCSENLNVYHINKYLGRETYDDVNILCENCLNN
ncbi:hypothetical protein ACQQ2T_11905 [Paraclostridium tenue]|uniref:HNH endonuclease n=1 Tax=Paeniclostridium hominis TaxID=2764329 RepID=A0ABR7K440_9FIRM|nr:MULTISPECIES: hypothetical protein [Paeniclostridium]MBC6003863.1 hypothetical protein [Paeniclostridium hominis]MDU1538906.1 hypothetical protein [Paeniclostridium sordellii]